MTGLDGFLEHGNASLTAFVELVESKVEQGIEFVMNELHRMADDAFNALSEPFARVADFVIQLADRVTELLGQADQMLAKVHAAGSYHTLTSM